MEYEDLTQEQMDRLNLLRHIQNSSKTDEQWEEYLKFYEMLDWEEPDRNEKGRPLHHPFPKKKKHNK
ncbi:MAG: hypothetical protein MR008_03285 [Aerococcus sp.]|nr:hypothetical protein [Aerococcus sp.]